MLKTVIMNATTSMNIARSYATRLYPLSNEVKKDIVKLLIDSIIIPETKPMETAEEKLERLCGCWANDPDMKDVAAGGADD